MSTYTSKVKTLLTGLPATAAEVDAVTADQGRLAELVDRWMDRPEFAGKMMEFFQQAFQQNQAIATDFDDQLAGPELAVLHADDQVRILRGLRQSFARTALQLIAEGRPFTDTLTTRRFMLTPPLMAMYAFMDAAPQDDGYSELDPKSKLAYSWMIRENPNFAYTWEHEAGPIPFADSIDPASPNYLTFYDPRPLQSLGQAPQCTDPVVVAPYAEHKNYPLTELFYFLFGVQPGRCGGTLSLLKPADYESWRMVTIRPPRAGEARTRFFDLPTLSTATELVLDTPRVGFLTTPSFFANYPTNPSNAARVTINQALIVGLGRSFDDNNATVQLAQISTSEAQHAMPGTVCYGCHKTLDPMRQFFRQSYTFNYHVQIDPAQIARPGTFTLDATTAQGSGVSDLAQVMSTHERFAAAWTQKLCRYANSSSCAEDDPEFERVTAVFRQSGYQWKILVRALFSSPLVTGAARTRTYEQFGPTLSISRREHLCAALSRRLGVADACKLDSQTGLVYAADRALQVPLNMAQAIPGGGFARGAESPLLPRDPSLFSDSAVENLCGLLANGLVDAEPPQAGRYDSAHTGEVIADLVGTVMGLPADDPRTPRIVDVFTRHVASARGEGASATAALRSAFVLACSSPLSVSMDL